MSDNAPGDTEIASLLGPAKALWDQLIEDLAADLEVTGQEWRRYSAKAAWSLRLKRGERVVVYLLPLEGGFAASFALGGKAMEEARASRFPKSMASAIAEAKKYPEGWAVRLEVRNGSAVTAVKRLAQIKIQY
jgi:hypothetical protein